MAFKLVGVLRVRIYIALFSTSLVMTTDEEVDDEDEEDEKEEEDEYCCCSRVRLGMWRRRRDAIVILVMVANWEWEDAVKVTRDNKQPKPNFHFQEDTTTSFWYEPLPACISGVEIEMDNPPPQ